MREMKPWGYIHPEISKILQDKAVCNTAITKKRAGYNTIPIYTADQLAEAVAAERERIVALMEGYDEAPFGMTNPSQGELISAFSSEIISRIRSAAK